MGRHGNDHDVFNLFKEHPILSCIVQVFDSEDVQAVKVALECLEAILSQGEKNKATPENPFILDMESIDAVTKLEKLQYHSSNDVYKKAQVILETYFEVVE
jgi:hypothetical protein